MQRLRTTLIGGLLAGAAAMASSPYREPVPFSHTWDVGYGYALFVTGNHADLGNWSPESAVKLFWTAGNTWTGSVAIQAGHALEYKFIRRSMASGDYCNGANVEWMPGANLTRSIPAQPPAPYAGKTVYYYSGWTNASLVYRVGTNWFGKDLERAGPGRSSGEYLYRADGVGEAGEGIEFVPNGWLDGAQHWDHAPYGGYGNSNYYTTLDVFLLQDGQIYNYWPAAQVAAPRVVTNYVDSSFAGISGRLARIYLPRGYDDHAWKRYPVLYLHDGQNVFSPGGPNGSWDADLTATREVSQGRMRECILVGLDHTTLRQSEYEPPGDTYYTGYPPGRGDAYVNFIVHNVRPALDFNFRTLNDFRNTLIGGSSMGGLISIYAGFETNVFGGVLALSPSITRAPNYEAALAARPKRPLRIYEDTGTDEGSVGPGGGNYWEKPWEAYDLFLAKGYAPNADLLMRIGCGHVHNESAWAARLPAAFQYLLDVRNEANRLAHHRFPPVLGVLTNPPAVTLRSDTLDHFRYQLEQSTNLLSGRWTRAGAAWTNPLPWGPRNWPDPSPPAPPLWYYRLTAEPVP
jgi:predicted alpha/beta superfamily hydrolase